MNPYTTRRKVNEMTQMWVIIPASSYMWRLALHSKPYYKDSIHNLGISRNNKKVNIKGTNSTGYLYLIYKDHNAVW